MCVEIEAKLKVDSLDKVRGRLKELGAEFVAELSQKDDFFDDSNNSMKNADSCLRLRTQIARGEVKYILTYKGAKQQSDYKKRREIEIEIADYNSICQLLEAIDYEKKITIEKRRGLWWLGGCEVALDSLPLLGDFVEIEGSDGEKIMNVQKQLGLTDIPHIKESYVVLITEKINKK